MGRIHEKTQNMIVKKLNFSILLILTIGFIAGDILLGMEAFVNESTRSLSLSLLIPINIVLIIIVLSYKFCKDIHKFRYISVILLLIIYGIILFGLKDLVLCGFLMPVIALYTLYNDIKIMHLACGVNLLLNVIRIPQLYKLGLSGQYDLTTFVMMLIIIALFYICQIINVKVSIKSKKIEMDNLNLTIEELNKLNYERENFLKVIKLNTNTILDTTKKLFESLGRVNNYSQEIKLDIEKGTFFNDSMLKICSENKNKKQDMNVKKSELIKEINKTSNNSKSSIDKLNNVEKIFENMVENTSKFTFMISELQVNIGNLSKMIESLMEITRKLTLLSFNAAIESGRDTNKQVGQSFSVISIEMRELSEHSKNSLEESETLIEDIIEKYSSVTEESNNIKAHILNNNQQIKEITQELIRNFQVIEATTGEIVEEEQHMDILSVEEEKLFDQLNELNNMLKGSNTKHSILCEDICSCVENLENIIKNIDEINGKMREN